MGSQWAPVMYSIVALHREHIHSVLFGNAIYSARLAASFRYVDNRLLLDRQAPGHTMQLQQFWNLNFYTEPILLETVDGFDALGFNLNPYQ